MIGLGGPICPYCGCEHGRYKQADSKQTHTLQADESTFTCVHCRKKFIGWKGWATRRMEQE